MSDPADISRYHRQTLLAGFGEGGQRRLLASKAVIVGCGALGCGVADLLARAGVGSLTIIDRDVVELTNLQRQTLFDERDAAEGLPKAEAAHRRLSAVNSGITLRAIVADVHAGNAEDQCAGHGVILDGTDNFETRYLLNDVAVKHGVPFVYGGVVGTRGMCMPVIPGSGPCLRCVFEEMPPPGSAATCDTVGVLGPAVAIVAGCQATEAIKLLVGKPDLVSRTLLDFDMWTTQRRRLEVGGPRPECPCCGKRNFEFLNERRSGFTTSLCGQQAVQVSPGAGATVDLAALADRLAPHGEFSVNRFLLRGRIDRERGEDGEPIGITVFADGRAIIKGVRKPEQARSLYARYVGA